MPDDESDEVPDGEAGSAEHRSSEPASEKPGEPVHEHAEPTMDSEADGEAPSAKPAEEGARAEKRPKKAKKSARAKKAPPAPPPSEAEIDSPDFRTLVALGAIFLVTAISWGSAKFACNYHPPESHEPPVVATERLARNPKDAAVELTYRWATKNFDLARELATGELSRELEKDAKACEGNGCAGERERLEKETIVSAVLLTRSGNTAEARVTSIVGSEKKVYRMRLERDGPIWKGTSRKLAP